jgi:SAM-dependent methyltransferase
MLSTDAKNNIRDQIKKYYNKGIKLSSKNNNNNTLKTKLEIETKFGRYVYNKESNKSEYRSDIDNRYYNRILQYLLSKCNKDNIYQFELSDLETLSNINDTKDTLRKISIIPTNEEDPLNIMYQRKQFVKNDNSLINDYAIKISYNTEEVIFDDEIKKYTETKNVFKRNRKRHSFIFDTTRVDITDVTEILDKNAKNKYEVEIELLNDSDNYSDKYIEDLVNNYDNVIKYIYEKMYDTNELFTINTKKLVYNNINNIIEINNLVKARNIKYNDIQYNKFFRDDKYYLTYKADGVRKLLYIHSTGIWLIYSYNEFNLVVKENATNKKFLNEFSGTILDGELLPINKYKVPININSNIKDYIRIYIGFDCLSYKTKNITDKLYIERLNMLNVVIKNIQDNIKNSYLYITRKRTEIIDTPEQFFILVKNFLDRKDDLPYQEDGLIFTKNNVYASTPLKWKDPKNITIDFNVSWGQDNIELSVYDDEKKDNVLFQGSDRYPFIGDKNNIRIDNGIIDNLSINNNTIVEFEWIWIDENNGYFQPRVIRFDKIGANKLKVAQHNWDDIMQPIWKEDITGETNKLVYKYHNRVKDLLYAKINFTNPTILDIGSGRGGDIYKWSRFGDFKVIAVEPNENNLQEFENRLSNSNIKDKVHIIKTSGQNTKEITEQVKIITNNTKVDVITLMLSMSFFWESEKTLNSLVNTIVKNLKSGGIILFLTINGDTLEQLFEPAFSDNIDITTQKTKTISDAQIILHPKSKSFGRMVDITLPDTIVGTQTEYVVHINDLTQKLLKHNILLIEQNRCEKEKLLSNSSLLFSSLYSYGYYKNFN